MKYLLFCLQLIALNLHAQNVGIGNTAPAEKLDVSGNIAVSGELRPNGTAGQAGDVLTNSGAGTMSWANAGSFKNMVSFTDTSTQYIYWNVPAGITKVWIECWGGGGAGLEAGGGGGGYLSIYFNVQPANTFAFGVGKGAKDAPQVFAQFSVAGSGGPSRIDFNGNYYIASGGTGALINNVNVYTVQIPGDGGDYLSSVPAATSPAGSFYFQKGQAGGAVKYDYQTVTPDKYYLQKNFGYGGASANSSTYTANGNVAVYENIISVASSTLKFYSSSKPGTFPGGGGGGALGFPNDLRAGANGLIIVHY